MMILVLSNVDKLKATFKLLDAISSSPKTTVRQRIAAGNANASS
jgi:hypothetical protein